MPRPKLSIKQILQWADTYYEEYGRWPVKNSKATIQNIRQGLDEKWDNINQSLRVGLRGLPPGGSLASLLAEHRGRRNRNALPNHTIRQILQWVDAYHDEHGKWPTVKSGPITGTNGETWAAVGRALDHGGRGLPGGNSLPRLLAAKRGVKNLHDQPHLSIRQILAWADAYHQRTGTWPSVKSGPIAPGADTSWYALDHALRRGRRGLRGGQSLTGLLAAKRGVSRHVRKPPFDLQEVLGWADAYRTRTGKWPTYESGRIPEAAGETWMGVHKALCFGKRGMPPGMSLAQILADERGVRNTRHLPKYTIPQILQWADAHHARYGKWPRNTSGPILGAPGETWSAVHTALSLGGRGLPGGTTLARLLAAKRGVPNRLQQPAFSVREILAWADAYHDRTGRWPVDKSGPVRPFAKTTWLQVGSALRSGGRGLPGGTSLSQLLADRRRSTRPKR